MTLRLIAVTIAGPVILVAGIAAVEPVVILVGLVLVTLSIAGWWWAIKTGQLP